MLDDNTIMNVLDHFRATLVHAVLTLGPPVQGFPFRRGSTLGFKIIIYVLVMYHQKEGNPGFQQRREPPCPQGTPKN